MLAVKNKYKHFPTSNVYFIAYLVSEKTCSENFSLMGSANALPRKDPFTVAN